MKSRSKRVVVCGVAILGIGVLVTGALALKSPIIEQYYLWKLESGNESERRTAAERLGTMRSIRTVPRLIKLLRGAPEELYDIPSSYEVLLKIGLPAVPALTRAVKDNRPRVRWRAADILREIYAAETQTLRMRAQNSSERRDFVAMAQQCERLTQLPGALLEDWLSLGRAYEQTGEWGRVIDAYSNAVVYIETQLDYPLERFIRHVPKGLVQRRVVNPIKFQVLRRGEWINLGGGDLTAARRFAARELKDLPAKRIELLFCIGRTQRDKLNDLDSAAVTFDKLLDKQAPSISRPLRDLAAERARILRGDEPDFSPWVEDYHQLSALKELAGTLTRMGPSRRTVQTCARLSLVSNSTVREKVGHVEELERAFQGSAEGAAGPLPPPLIPLTPKDPRCSIQVRQPDPSLQPFYWFINPAMDIRYYAFSPPHGLELATAKVVTEKTAKLHCSPTSRTGAAWMDWDFSRDERSTYREHGREMALHELEFQEGTGLLLIEINNAREVQAFTVQATFRKCRPNDPGAG